MVGLEEDRVDVGGRASGAAEPLLGAQDRVLSFGLLPVAVGLLEFAESEQLLRQGAAAMAAV
ncbi:hypothetical protein ACFYYB_35370 [Streptomyces sp. NPDC002886]|uniref:hypothetical protein n=1 Tax=Streptomyces sp. NPDC002886 TaxID=3364667 RepID=UPI00367FFDDF